MPLAESKARIETTSVRCRQLSGDEERRFSLSKGEERIERATGNDRRL